MEYEIEKYKTKVRELKRKTLVVYFVSRDSLPTWYIKTIEIILSAYALSPIDYTPDFVPAAGGD